MEQGMKQDYDVIVIGAGPAGTTIAALLAQKKYRVLILEKESMPRYTIGESLLPFCYSTLNRLGLIEQLKSSHFSVKLAVQFVSQNGRASLPFYFNQYFPGDIGSTWHVKRYEFDKMLLENAKKKGVTVLENTRVKELITQDHCFVGLKAVDQANTVLNFKAKAIVDASGKRAFTAVRYGWRVNDPKLKKIAIWTYFKGIKFDSESEKKATTIAYIPLQGWFWFIPLSDDVVSVGVVAERDYLERETKNLEDIFNQEAANNKWITARLMSGQRIDKFRIIADYSYRSQYCAADGLVLVGDAFAFLDPVFSSGVFLAFKTAEFAADALDLALTQGDVSAKQFTSYGIHACQYIEAMRKLVYAFYTPEFRFGKFLSTHPHLKGLLTDCLSGNLEIDYTELFDTMSQYISLPQPIEYGIPLINDKSC